MSVIMMLNKTSCSTDQTLTAFSINVSSCSNTHLLTVCAYCRFQLRYGFCAPHKASGYLVPMIRVCCRFYRLHGFGIFSVIHRFPITKYSSRIPGSTVCPSATKKTVTRPDHQAIVFKKKGLHRLVQPLDNN